MHQNGGAPSPADVRLELCLPQNIMIHRPVKHFLHFRPIMGLPQNPHQFRYRRLQRHIIRFQQPKLILDGPSYFIDRHITAFVGNLRGHNHGFALGDPFLHGFMIAGSLIVGQSANAEGLNDDSVIMVLPCNPAPPRPMPGSALTVPPSSPWCGRKTPVRRPAPYRLNKTGYVRPGSLQYKGN